MLSVSAVAAPTVTESDEDRRTATTGVADRGSDPAARAWERSLLAALEARATELAGTAAEAADTIARALLTALEAAKASGAWAEVAELARALDSHRHARAGVSSIDVARRRRGSGGKRP